MRIGPAAREDDKAAVILRLAKDFSAPDPAYLLACRKLVKIEDGFPCGIGFLVFVESRAPPQASRMLLVAPKVVIEFSVLSDEGNSVFRIQGAQQTGSQRLEIRPGFQSRDRAGILLLDPIEARGPVMSSSQRYGSAVCAETIGDKHKVSTNKTAALIFMVGLASIRRWGTEVGPARPWCRVPADWHKVRRAFSQRPEYQVVPILPRLCG